MASRWILTGLFMSVFAQAADPWIDFNGDSLVRKPNKDSHLTVQISGESAKAVFDQLMTAQKLFGKKSRILSVGEKDIRGKKYTLVRAENVACGKDTSAKYTCSFFVGPDAQASGDPDLGPPPDGE
jgi:hypothetical protein